MPSSAKMCAGTVEAAIAQRVFIVGICQSAIVRVAFSVMKIHIALKLAQYTANRENALH
jgi:hypothetical protein